MMKSREINKGSFEIRVPLIEWSINYGSAKNLGQNWLLKPKLQISSKKKLRLS